MYYDDNTCGIKVSVIVPAYNQEKYIGTTLESIVNQKTTFKFEVLVGEDCSIDGTAEVVKKYAADNQDLIFPYYREKNLGIADNPAELFTHARGEYIAFIDGDDYWIDENKLQKQVDFLDAHRDYAACFGKCIIVDKNGKRLIEVEKNVSYINENRDYVLYDFQQYLLPGQTASSMYRRKSIDAIALKFAPESFNFANLFDRKQILLTLSVGKIKTLGDYFSAYRYNLEENSVTWSSKNDIYSYDSLMNFLIGLKELENLAQRVELTLDYDDRRGYELKKLYLNNSSFSKKNFISIKKQIKKDYNSKFKYWKSNIMNIIRGIW